MRKITLFTMLVSLLSATFAHAAVSTWSGNVTLINQNTQASGGNAANVGYVAVSGTYNGTHPSCATNTSILAFDPTTIGGQNAFRALMAAKLAGSNVVLFTTGACAVGGNVEDIILFQF